MNQTLRINCTVFSSIKQAFAGIPFLLAVIGTVIALGIGGFHDCMAGIQASSGKLLENGYHYTIFQTALSSDAMCLALPIMSALPFTASFLEDIESGFIKAYLHRSGRGHYIAGKMFGCGLSGGVVSVFGIVLYYGILQLIFLPMEKEASQVNYLPDVLRACVLFFCAGMFFSLVGMLFSVITASKFMAYASPFVFCYVLIILHERYLNKIYILDPKEWIIPTDSTWVFGIWGSVLWMLEIILLAGGVLCIMVYRRIEEV